MRIDRVVRRSDIPAPPDVVRAWLARPGTIERLLPPWEKVRLVTRDGGGVTGGGLVLLVRTGLFRAQWTIERDPQEAECLRMDGELPGPLGRWAHTRRVEPSDAGGTLLTDEVEVALRLGAMGNALAARRVRSRIGRALAWRHRTAREDLARHAGAPPRRVLVSGSSGFLGSALVAFLASGGHAVTRLVRRPAGGAGELAWTRDLARAEGGFDAVIHLGGAGVADRRWSAARRRTILSSRVESTDALARAISAWPERPRLFIVASGLGFYGVRCDEPTDERAPGGPGFLAEVCRAWEAAAGPAPDAGIRVAHLRPGMVLSSRGGALARMLPAFRWGLGGVLGDGRQPVAWIGLDDFLYAVLHVMNDEGIEGPVNLVAPSRLTNREWTRALARAVGRPVGPPAPAFALRALFGDMADELLLGGVAAVPGVLAARGFRFAWPEPDRCLAHLLGSLDEPRPARGGAEGPR